MIKKGSMFLIFFLGLFYGSQALAWNAYHLYNKDGTDIWAIECADGTLHSYAGSSAGLSTVGRTSRENHGALRVQVESLMNSCEAIWYKPND